MKFTADHHFSIGDQHLRQGKPCQDYALSGASGNTAYVVVSDGCSSGGNTDVGARLTAIFAAKAIKDRAEIKYPIGPYQELGLESKDMLATCIYASASPDGVNLRVLGDGVIAWKSKTGFITMQKFEWAKNAPLYPAYAEDNFLAFINFHGGDISAEALATEEWQYSIANGYEFTVRRNYSIEKGISGISEYFGAEKIKSEEIEFIAIFSDGALQIENMDWKDTVTELLAFKNIAGSFVKRRTISFLKKGAKAVDDLACAVIRIEDSGKEEKQCPDASKTIT